MNYTHFTQSLQEEVPPAGISPELQSLWYDGKDNWHQAHEIAQDIPRPNGAWIHAYLHRKEGDQWNANYWYRQAGRKSPGLSLKEEWEALVRHFLGQ